MALNSAEAERYALTQGAVQALGLITFMADMGVQVKCTVHTDAKAAIGIARRVGLRKLRHLNVRYFWLEYKLHNIELAFLTVHWWKTQHMFVTKLINLHFVTEHMRFMDMRTSGIRAANALTRSSIANTP